MKIKAKLGKKPKIKFHKGDMYCLASLLAPIMAELLIEFRRVDTSFENIAMNGNEGDYGKELNKMIWSFERIAKSEGFWDFDEKTENKIREGLRAFSDYYFGLWT